MGIKAERVQVSKKGYRYFKVHTDEDLEPYTEFHLCDLCGKPNAETFYVLPWFLDRSQVYCEKCFELSQEWDDLADQDDFALEKIKSDAQATLFGHCPEINVVRDGYDNAYIWNKGMGGSNC